MTHGDDFGFATRSIHAGESPDPVTGALGVPIYTNATFAFRSAEQLAATNAGQIPHYTYAREGSPTQRCLELKIANLEGAGDALATASGMAAITTALFQLLPTGSHVIASSDVYLQAKEFFCDELPRHGVEVSLVDFTDLAAVNAAIRPATRLLYFEVLSNATMKVTDLRAVAALAKERDLLVVVDNTYFSPALLRPIEHGADLVIHSATKYLSGHGQTVGGLVAGRTDLIAPIRDKLILLGGTISPFAAWILLQGIKTLPLRIARHSANAMRLAQRFTDHQAVSEVLYPGLPTDPGHEVIRSLVGEGHDRFGGMLCLRLHGGPDAFTPFLNHLRLVTLAVSLGECETLAWPRPYSNMIRLSIGLEDPDDLERDLIGALDTLKAAVAAD